MNLTRFLLHEARENLGLAFYTKPQKFKVTYSCTVTNIKPRKNHVTTILPTPPNTDNQKVTKINLLPTGHMPGKGIIYWQDVLKPNENKTYAEEFLVEIKPSESSIYKNSDKQTYTNSEKHVDFTNAKIKHLISKLSPPKDNFYLTARYINNVVVKMLRYGNPTEGLYSSVESISGEHTDCGGFSTLMAALLRYYKIPARIVCGYLLAPDNSVMHAWVEFMQSDKKWIPADPTIENLQKKHVSKRSGKFGFVGSDHLVLSYGSDVAVKINNVFAKMDIIQNPIVIAKGGRKTVEVDYSLTANFSK